MNLDITTLLVVTVACIVAMALASPAVMGPRLGQAAASARLSLVVHAAGWMSMIASNLWPETWADRVLSTAAVTGFGASNWLLMRALGGWLGPRRFSRAVAWLAIAAPVGYGLAFSHYGLRVGWSNFLLAAQMSLVALACFRPTTAQNGHWRLVVALGIGTMAVLTLGRGVLGAFTDLYPTFLTPHPWNVAAMLMTSLAPVVINFALLGGWHEEAEAALRLQAVTDSLTGVLNRRGWNEVAQPIMANANRHDLPLALLMIDIDLFKQINDTHGHDAGDRALQIMGALLRRHRRAGDVAARIGGEEFCLLLLGAQESSGRMLDQRMRDQLRQTTSHLGYALQFSSGLAIRRSNESLQSLMMRADTALYAAKDAGRNRLHFAG